MSSFTIGEMQEMQHLLQEKYKDRWEHICPAIGSRKLLWMIGEASEVGDIMKKCGEDEIMNNPETRAHFIEEMADVLMYFNEVMMCFDINEDDLKAAYTKKFERNMKRW